MRSGASLSCPDCYLPPRRWWEFNRTCAGLPSMQQAALTLRTVLSPINFHLGVRRVFAARKGERS